MKKKAIFFIIILNSILFSQTISDDSIKVNFESAFRSFQMGDYETSYSKLRDLYNYAPNDTAFNYYLGYSAFNIDNYNEADQYLSKYYSIVGNDWTIIPALIVSNENLEHYEKVDSLIRSFYKQKSETSDSDLKYSHMFARDKIIINNSLDMHVSVLEYFKDEPKKYSFWLSRKSKEPLIRIVYGFDGSQYYIDIYKKGIETFGLYDKSLPYRTVKKHALEIINDYISNPEFILEIKMMNELEEKNRKIEEVYLPKLLISPCDDNYLFRIDHQSLNTSQFERIDIVDSPPKLLNSKNELEMELNKNEELLNLSKSIFGIFHLRFLLTCEGKIGLVEEPNEKIKEFEFKILNFLQNNSNWEPAKSTNKNVDCINIISIIVKGGQLIVK